MLQPLTISENSLARCLIVHYGIEANAVRRISGGLDPLAISYEVTASDGVAWFVKLRIGGFRKASLEVPRYLAAAGVPNLLTPIPAHSKRAWCDWEGMVVTVFPFVRGQDAASAGLTASQWLELGRTLSAIHQATLPPYVLEGVRREALGFPSREVLSDALEASQFLDFESVPSKRLAEHLRKVEPQIRQLISKADELRSEVLTKSLPQVVCHADVHPWNLLVSQEGKIYVVDWEDGPLIAPRERDLIFFVRTEFWSPVEERQESLLLEGYGDTEIDRAAVSYFQLERVIEDLAVDANRVFMCEQDFSEEMRSQFADQVIGYRLPSPGGSSKP